MSRKKIRNEGGGERRVVRAHTRNSGIRDSIIGVEDEMRKIVTKYRTTVANARDTSARDVVVYRVEHAFQSVQRNPYIRSSVFFLPM